MGPLLWIAASAALLPAAPWLAAAHSSAASVALGLLLLPSMLLSAVTLLVALRAGRRLAAAACLAALCPGIALSALRAAHEPRPAAASPETPTISLVTQNLLFSARGDRTVPLLRRQEADVVCLQEVTPTWARRLDATFAATHPHRAVEARQGAYGVAIYSRLPLAAPTLVQDGRRLAGQCVAIAPGGAETVLCNVHLLSPANVVGRGARWVRNFDENARLRSAQWRLLRAHVARAYPRAKRLVVAGDFNTLDGEPLYREIRGQLVDAFAAAGTGRGATFPNEPASPFPLVRIDYVFASPALAPRAAEVLPPGDSDHLGLRVTLAIPRGAGYRTSSNAVPPGPVVKPTEPR